MRTPHNNGLHQTRRVGVAASRPVVEARLAGEAGCSTGAGIGSADGWLDRAEAAWLQ